MPVAWLQAAAQRALKNKTIENYAFAEVSIAICLKNGTGLQWPQIIFGAVPDNT